MTEEEKLEKQIAERKMQVGKIDAFFHTRPEPTTVHGILSFRDQAAIAALQGLLSSKPFNKVDISRSAYEYADEMIRAREQ